LFALVFSIRSRLHLTLWSIYSYMKLVLITEDFFLTRVHELCVWSTNIVTFYFNFICHVSHSFIKHNLLILHILHVIFFYLHFKVISQYLSFTFSLFNIGLLLLWLCVMCKYFHILKVFFFTWWSYLRIVLFHLMIIVLLYHLLIVCL
jgi:hypothetical protein